MRRFLVLLVCAFASQTAFLVSAFARDSQPPNILLVIADDMGLDASPCYPTGGEKPDMPVLESLCRDGLVFENFYSQPSCSPTRATILTGRYGFRTGVLFPSGGRHGGGISPDEVSVQRFLDDHAAVPYAHAVIGKWHLSDDENGGAENPERMGVGFYSGFLSGALPDYYDFPLTTNGETRQVGTYATTVFTDIAIDWLSEQNQPWFLWLAHTAPHTPFHLPPAKLHDRNLDGDPAAIRRDPLPYYLAALEALDHEMGRLLDSLSRSELENTVVLFMGDNGSPPRVAQQPYSRQTVKGTLYPGGVNVPLIVAGAGVTRHGELEAALVNSTDLFATIADLAGATAPPPQDSISFRPLLNGQSAGRTITYADLEAPPGMRMARNNGWMIGDGRYQYLHLEEFGPVLIDRASDPGGKANLLDTGSAQADAVAEALEERGRALRATP